MYRIRRFNVVKTATVVAVMYMVIIAVFVVPFLILFAFVGIAGSSQQAQGGVGALLGIGIFAILFYAILGWIFTAIACVIYNLVAGWIGGIEVQVEPVAPPPPPPAWISPTPPPTNPAPPTAPPSDPLIRVV
jgi:hypothetical protein